MALCTSFSIMAMQLTRWQACLLGLAQRVLRSSSTAIVIWLISLFRWVDDLMLADGGPGGPDLERVFIAELFTFLDVDLGVLAAPPALDLAGLDAAGLDLI